MRSLLLYLTVVKGVAVDGCMIADRGIVVAVVVVVVMPLPLASSHLPPLPLPLPLPSSPPPHLATTPTKTR